MSVRSVVLFLIAALGLKGSYGLELRGKVVLTPSGCPIAGLTVEIDPEKGSPQAKVVTTTDSLGNFDVSLADGRYLIQVFQSGRKVYQEVISGSNITPLNVAVASVTPISGSFCTPPTPLPATHDFTPQFSHTRDWRPNDLSYSSDLGLLVLDDYGRVTKIYPSDQGTVSSSLFSLPSSARPVAISSGTGRVFVTSASPVGCTVYEYEVSTKRLTPHVLGPNGGPCSGVATNGVSTVVGFPRASEVRFFPALNFDKPQSIELTVDSRTYNFAFDFPSNQLYIGDSNGTVYRSSFGSSSKPQIVIEHAGPINSLALSTNYVLIASGNHLLCYKKTDFSLLNVAACMNVSVSGEVVGVRVDLRDQAWILERDQNSIIGPITLR
jgi:hypothetical protein